MINTNSNGFFYDLITCRNYILMICFHILKIKTGIYELEKEMSRIKIMNTEIDNLTMSETLDCIDMLINTRVPSYVVTPNIDHIVQLETDVKLQKAYQKAALIITDGKPLIWISKYYKKTIKEKISGSDVFPLLCDMAAKRGYSIFLLGAAEGVAKKAAENLKKKYNGLNVCGTYSPKHGFEKDDKEIKKIKEIIKSAKPDILVVGLGCPKQEYFMYDYYQELNVPVYLGLGATIDFEAGIVKRAPKWIANSGFEWLYRITQDPKRLIKRYWKDIKSIIPIVIKYK